MVRRVVPAGLRNGRNGNSEYVAYLESEHWKNTRRSALLLARYRCKECKTSEALEVHHLHYRSLGEENVLTDLLVLCASCHQKRHAGKGWKKTVSGNWVRWLSEGRCITVFRRESEFCADPLNDEWCFVCAGNFSQYSYGSAGSAMDAAMGGVL